MSKFSNSTSIIVVFARKTRIADISKSGPEMNK